MDAKLVLDRPERTWVLVFSSGDEAVGELERFAREQELAGAHFTGIGAFREATLGYFRWDRKEYDRIPVREQVEVVAFTGDVALGERGPKIHAHAVVARSDGSAMGGHLLEGRVRPTLELVVTETPRPLVRRHDPASGLALIDLRAEGG